MNSSTASASCAMPTEDESNYSANGTLHPHHTDRHTTMAYTAIAQRRAIKIHRIQIWPT